MTLKNTVRNISLTLSEDKYLLAILFVVALLIRTIVFIQNGNHAADGMYRTILTINWLKDPHFITGGIWPPLDLYIMAFMVKILGDPFTSTRLVSLIFGTLIIFPYYYLVKLLFDKRVAAISTLILSFLSIHIQYSTYSMSEVPFAFFLITSLYFFFRFKTGCETVIEKRLTNLIISAVFLNLASMIRYEAWLFIPLLTVFTLNRDDLKNISLKNISLKNDHIIYFITFMTISLIFPVFWIIGNYQMYGDFFYSQHWSDNWIRTNIMLNTDSQWYNPSLIKKLAIWPETVLYKLNIVAIFAGIGALVSLLRKKNLEFLFIFLILISIFTYKLINLTMYPQSRHIIVPILFIIPYFIAGIDYFIDYPLRYLCKNSGRLAMILVIGLFIITSSHTAIVKNYYVTPDYVFDVSNWLKVNIRPSDTILLDDYNWWGLHILFFQ